MRLLRTLEGRLLGRLLTLALLPTLLVLAAAWVVGSRSLEWLGSLGPWTEVAESGRVLIDETAPAAAEDPALAAARERHRIGLSESLTQAQRWGFIGERMIAAAPGAVLFLILLIAASAWAVSRRLAREMARPIQELVGWSARLAAGEAIPVPNRDEDDEVVEVRALRSALRDASAKLAESRRRELEAERLRAWGEMARRVAHEMKNPLTPLRLAAHHLGSARLSPEAAGASAVIREETARLEALAAEFAALGRPADGPASAVDLEEMLGTLLATDVPPPVRVTLDIASDAAMIDAHYEALRRAFRNLVLNAVDAVGARDDAAIELSVSADHDGGVRIVVADNGTGIPDGLAERIFEPDFTRKRGGTGLGLAVVRQTIAAHGGRVSARHRNGGGAEFVVWLPSSPLPHATESRGDPGARAAAVSTNGVK